MNMNHCFGFWCRIVVVNVNGRRYYHLVMILLWSFTVCMCRAVHQLTVLLLLMQESKPSLAVCALESLVTHSSNPQQLLTSLRCLIRLTVTALGAGENKLLVHSSIYPVASALSSLGFCCCWMVPFTVVLILVLSYRIL